MPKITDFGLARRITEASGPTRGGEVLGTPSYLSPEQASGEVHRPTPATDVWALGAVLYECLTGRPPFLAGTAMETVLQVLSSEPAAPRLLNPAVPVDLNTITLKCLEKDPRRRYATASDLADDLGRFLRDEPVQARPPSPLGRLLKWARRRPVAAAFLAFVLLSVAGFSAVVLGFNRSLRKERDQARRLQGEAEQARSDEQQQRLVAEDRLVRQYLTRSTQLMEEGDPFGALPLQVEALALEAGREARVRVHRLRLGTALGSVPRLVQLWRHEGPVHDAVLSPDGTAAASAGEDGTACVWDVRSGQRRHALPHGAAVLRVAFSPDGRLLATGDQAGAVRLWEAKTGKPVRGPVLHGGAVTALAFSPDGRRLLSSSRAGTAVLQDGRGGSEARLLGLRGKAAGGPVLFARFSPDGRLAVTTSAARSAQLWHADSGEPAGPPLPHDYPVLHAVFSADGAQLVTAASRYRSAGGTGQVVVWDVEGKKPPRTFPRARPFRRLALMNDSAEVVAALHTGHVQVWDLASGEPSHNAHHRGPVTDVVLSPDERRILSASADGTAAVWQVHQTITQVGPVLRHAGAVTRATFDGTGRIVLTASTDGTVRLWDLAPLAPPVAMFHSQADRAVVSPDGSRVLTASRDGTARVWDAATGEPRTGWLPHGWNQRIERARWSPDGRFAVTAGSDGGIRLWDAASGALRWRADAHRGGAQDAAFRPDGQELLSGGADGMLRRWDVRTGQPAGKPLAAGAAVRGAVWLADGQGAAVLLADESVRLWQMGQKSREYRRLRPGGPGAQIDEVGLSPNGERLVAAGSDGRVHVHDARTGEPAEPGIRSRTGMSLAFFGPAGKTVAGLGLDRTASVWEVRTGKLVCGPLPHPDPRNDNVHTLLAGSFSADGELLLTGASNGLARVWDVDAGELLAPPWRHPYPAVSSVAFHQAGRGNGVPRLLTTAFMPEGGGLAAMWDLPAETMPLADLRLLALVLSGQRVAGGGVKNVTGEQIEKAWLALKQRHPERFRVSDEEVHAWLRWEAQTSWRAGQLRGLDNVLEPLARSEPSGWLPHLLRGQMLWPRGQADSAASAFALARRHGGKDERLWTWEAACRLQANDVGGYRQVCADVLERWGETRVPERALDAARLCVYRPEGMNNSGRVVALARLAAEGMPDRPEAQAVLGGALWRSGQKEAARKVLEEQRRKGAGQAAGEVEAFLGLLEKQTGAADQARRHLDEARKALAGPAHSASWRTGLRALVKELEEGL